MPKELTMYECEYCKKKRYKNKSSAVRHEKKCFRNPETKSCATCEFYFPGNKHCSKGYKDMSTNCTGYKWDEMTLEERYETYRVYAADRQADMDEYYASALGNMY